MPKKTSAARLQREIDETLTAKRATKATPFHTTRCYACGGKAVGVRDLRPEGGMIEAACRRHADPRIKAYAACVYCSGPRPTLLIDGQFAHKGCHAEAEQS
jgi:hypothetical protein